MTISDASTVRDQLRALTEPVHARLEEMYWSPRGFPDLGTYRQFLGRMRRAHRTFGLPAALAEPGIVDPACERRALSLIDQDLGPTGAAPGDPVIADITRDHAWGIGYALTGSALGASLILKSGSMAPDWPTGYLAFMRDRARDGEIRRFFDALNASNADPEPACAGAMAVFTVLEGSPSVEQKTV